MRDVYASRILAKLIGLKELKRPEAFAAFVFVFVNFIQLGILEAVQSKLQTLRKACWSSFSL